MDINNNALNLSLSGTQTFDGQIDYKIKMKLNDLLANKFRSNRKTKMTSVRLWMTEREIITYILAQTEI